MLKYIKFIRGIIIMIDKIQYKLLLDGTIKKPDGSDTTKELLNYIRDSKPKTLFRYRACNDFTLL